MKNILLTLATIALISCGTDEGENSNFKVEHKGALKNMMHKGDLSAKVDLKEFENVEHLYALGAFENLKGEIQIFDGKAFNTSVENETIQFDNTFEKKACLFVYASVSEWKTIDIPADITTYESFEIYIAKVASENNIDIKKPFPFLLEGTPTSFDWHVINWKDGDTEHSHEKHIQSGLNGTIENKAVHMLGFYSDSHHAIFTHHTTNMHIHVKTDDGKIAGHVDALTLAKGMTLKLPVVNK